MGDIVSHFHRRAVVVCSLLLGCQAAAEQPVDRRRAASGHLFWAEELVERVEPEDNTYGTAPTYVTWAGVDGAAKYANRSVCATFLTAVLRQAHGWNVDHFKDWMDSTSPTAARYHDAIVAENRFSRITAVSRVAPGDILAIRYPEGGAVTGHVAIVASAAAPRGATAPIVPDTRQYEVTVIDSSQSAHGPADTRRRPDGTTHAGAGRGVLRLYGDAHDQLVGYTWSTYPSSIFYSLSARHLVVGRLR